MTIDETVDEQLREDHKTDHNTFVIEDDVEVEKESGFV